MKLNLKRPLHIILIILIVAALTFIIVESSLSHEKSVEHSQKVEAALDKLTSNKNNGSTADNNQGGESVKDNAAGSVQGTDSDNKKPESDKGGADAQKPADGETTAKKVSLRKIAHFVEHGILGMLMLLLAISMESEASKIKRLIPLHPRRVFLVINMGVLIALFDETVQIFSGRGSSVKDIWLDISGSVSFIVLTYLIAFSVYLCKYKLMKRTRDAAVFE
ncbi:MAG: VanZ family protein [Ruminococcaceae bacterium]|nr:VanZ family protein [Oscillospiraceae bacterium]